MINTIYSINAKPFLGEDEKYHYLYKITNSINQKYYIGIHSTNNLNDNYCGSGKAIIEAIAKYGVKCFVKEILAFYPTRYELSNAEHDIIGKTYLLKESYNECPGGDMKQRFSDPEYYDIYVGYKRSDEQRKLLSERSKAQWRDPEYRKRYFETIKNEEYIEKQRQRTKEMWKDPEYRRKVSESNKKAYSDPELRKYMSEINKGKKRSEETRKRIGAASKGRICSPEKRKKLSESGKGKGAGDKNAMAKPLYQIDRAFNIVCEFGSRKSAMATVDFPLSQMIKSTKKFTLSPNGFYYIYKEDYQEFMYFINFENEVFE